MVFHVSYHDLVLFRDSLLPRPMNGPEPRREKRESCITCRRMLGTTPFFPPKLGKNHIWKEIPNLGIVYSQCFYAENMAGKLKENYDAKFLEAIDFAFKKCQFNFVPKAEQVQAIHAVVTGNDVFVRVATGFGKSVCYFVVPYICDYLRSESEVSSQSVLLIVSPLKALMEDQIDDIRKCGISCLKLHGELPSEQLHDVGAGKLTN